MGRSDPDFIDAESSRRFAVEVVKRLRGAGHEALWAGGCVRDELLGRVPTDYDVATSALPEAVRECFGRRKTLPLGAAFGVITVVGPPRSGQVEVATFRTDADYTDGRHPAGVTFSTAREDALRRDFTINGMFLDPLTGAIHDFVGGREDLANGVVRAIGDPAKRFAEDHLRMLRAVRFTAGFGFVLDAATRAAIETMGRLVEVVSPERTADELRRMLSGPGRTAALRMLADTGLAAHVLGEFAGAACGPAALVIGALDEPCLPAALAELAWDSAVSGAAATALDRVRGAASRLRLSNRETKLALWLVEGVAALEDAAAPGRIPWSRLQPWVAHADAPLLADLLRARAGGDAGRGEQARWFSAQVDRPRAEIDPPAWLTGADMLAAGIGAGPAVGRILGEARRRQLDGELASREAARAWLAGQRKD
jgi:tRNA nucleotidyltransferase/poly(A) polymerase